MQLESAKYLEDIREAGRTVLQATAGLTLDDYPPRLARPRSAKTRASASSLLQIPELMQELMRGQ